MSLLYSPPMIRRLCAVLRPASDIFASTSSRADKPQKQIRRKGHLQARRAAFSVWKYPYTPATLNGLQRPAQRHTRHKATPAHSTRRKPGLCHLFRARERTAQRSAVWSYQAQYLPRHFTTSIASLRPISWTSCVHWPDSIKGHSRLSLKSSAIVL